MFTTKRTFLTPELAAIYRVPFASDVPNGSPDAWGPYEYPASDPRAGILSQVSFTALHSPPGRGSATIRGKALREIVLCQKVPSPPANVNFKIVLDTSNPVYKTARERLTAHRSNPVCAGCHKFVDPIGLSLENFDGIGAYRTRENDVLIDTSGELGGNKFDGPEGPSATRCTTVRPLRLPHLVNRLESYALGRQLTQQDQPAVQELQQSFAAPAGYRLPDAHAPDRDRRELLSSIAAAGVWILRHPGALICQCTRQQSIESLRRIALWSFAGVIPLRRKMMTRRKTGVLRARVMDDGAGWLSVGHCRFSICLFLELTRMAALAATGAPLPVCFGIWWQGLGLTPGDRWLPDTVWRRAIRTRSSSRCSIRSAVAPISSAVPSISWTASRSRPISPAGRLPRSGPSRLAPSPVPMLSTIGSYRRCRWH